MAAVEGWEDVPAEVRKRHAELAAEVEDHRVRYYEQDAPVISAQGPYFVANSMLAMAICSPVRIFAQTAFSRRLALMLDSSNGRDKFTKFRICQKHSPPRFFPAKPTGDSWTKWRR